MNTFTRHVTRCLVAGLVALLPIGGLVLSIAYMESTIADSGLGKLPHYFPGLGLLAVGAAVYLLGLFVSTFLGRWLFRSLDRFLERLPTLGGLYGTFKQILGYGRGKDAVFQDVVLVPDREGSALELGLVTGETRVAGGDKRLIVFFPGSPNPTSGRLQLLAPDAVRPIELSVTDSLKALLSLGKTPLEGAGE
jgi:uncharacterized membrane protein